MEQAPRRWLKVSFTFTAAALILAALFGVLASRPAQAAQSVPYLINFQGRLTDNSGNVLPDGSYNIKFRLWTQASGGSNVWQADRVRGASDNRVELVNGLFNIQFGDTTKGDPALSPSLFNGSPYLHLEVELPTPATASCATNGCAVFTEGAMTPRQPLASSPYAMNADALDGLDSDAFVQLSPASQQTGNINISGNLQAGGNLQATGTVQGASATFTGASSLTLGTAGPAGNTGAILFRNATNANTVTLQSGVTSSPYALTLPTALASSGDCLVDTTGAGALGFAACAATLQDAYDNSTSPATITTSAAAKNIVIKSGGGFNSTTAFQVVPDATSTPTLNIDTQNNRVGIGMNNPAETLDVAGAIRVGTTAGTVAGSIRWTGTDFEGFDGTTWLSLTNEGLVQTTPTIAKRKTSADTTLASTTAFTTETDLNVAIGANESWAMRWTAHMNVGSAPDVKFSVQAPSGATCKVGVEGIEDAIAIGNAACGATIAHTVATVGPLPDVFEIVATVVNGSTAGNVSLQWAPNVSSATNTIFRQSSTVTAFRISGTNTAFEAFVQGGNSFNALAQIGTNDNFDVSILTNGTEKLRVTTSGTLQLGSSPPASATASLLQLTAPIAGGSASGTFIGANPTSFAGDFINFQVNGSTVAKLNSFGDYTTGFTALNGTSTASANGTNSTSLALASAANFDIGNYVQMNSANCGGAGVNPCYAKITNKVVNTLTITPALTWTNGSTVNEYHVPEIGGTNVQSPTLANRFGRGYFIAGVGTGNGTTFYNEEGIETSLTDYSIVPSVTNLSVGSASTTVNVPGSLSVAGQSIVNGSGEINGAQIQAGTIANGALTNSSVTVTAGNGLTGGGGVALGASTSLAVAYGSGANTAVEGNTTITCPSGSGNLTGGGTSITLGAGGTCGAISTVNNPSFSTSVTSPSYTGTGAVNVSSGGSSALTLNSASGTLVLGASTTALQKSATAFTLDLNNAAASTLSVTNAGAGVASLSVEGGLTIGSGTAITVGASAGQSSTVACSVGQAVTAAVFTGGILTTAPTCAAVGGSGGATTALDNLTTTNINQSLLPDSNNARSLGSPTAVWQNVYTGNIDAGTTTTTLAVGTAATTTAITIGRSGLQVSIPGGLSSTSTITTSGALTVTGSGTISQTYAAASGTADTRSVTASGASGTNTVNALSLGLTGTATSGANTLTALNIGNVAAAANNTFRGINFGTGFTNLMTYNGSTVVINGTGQLNGAQLSTGTVANGALTNSSITVTAGNGLTGGGAASLGGSTSLAVSYGSAANTAVQGNTSLVCPSGSGNLTGGGTNITLGAGGTCGALSTINNPSFTTSVTSPLFTGTAGVSLTSGTASALTIDSGTTGALNIGTGTTSAKTITIGPTATNTNTTNYQFGVNTAGAQNFDVGSTGSGNANAGTTINLQGGTTAGTAIVLGTNTTGGITIDSGTTGSINIANNANAKTVQIGNTTAGTTLNFEGSALNIGDSAITKTIDIGGVTNSGTDTISIATNGTLADTVTIGNSTALTAVNIDAGATGRLQLGNSTAAHLIQIGAGGAAAGNAQNVAIGSGTTTTASTVVIQAGNINTTNGGSGIILGGGYSAADTNLVGLTLDSSTTFAETASTCSATVNPGTLYYNSTTNSLRTCIRDPINTTGGWEDIPSTAGLGIIIFGVVPDSGLTANQGDWAGIGGANVGPCKASRASATTVSIAPCVAYSAGRKVVVSTAATITMPAMAVSTWVHICFNASGVPAVSAAGTELANLPTFSTNNPLLCLADVQNSTTVANTIGKIYDVRTFTNTTKAFVTISTAAAGLGQTVSTVAGTNSVRQVLTTTNTSILRGVVVSTTGTTSTTAINGIIAVAGPQWVKFAAAAGTINAYLQPITGGVAGFVNSSATVGTIAYGNLGLQLRVSDNATCTAATNCQMSVPTIINLR